MLNVDPLSMSSLYVKPFFQGIQLGNATAFCVEVCTQLFLVTNWHVVSGKHPDTEVCLDKNLCIPDRLKISFHKKGNIGEWLEKELLLYSENGSPLWIEHPDGCWVDVVLLPLARDEAVNYQLVDLNGGGHKALLCPAFTVSIIGYPITCQPKAIWPVWKTGHIATEPGLDFDGKPLLLVDATTRPGMSGSPVVIRTNSLYRHKSGGLIGLSNEYITNFLGIYSGRTSEHSELGRVWKPKVIGEIFRAALSIKISLEYTSDELKKVAWKSRCNTGGS